MSGKDQGRRSGASSVSRRGWLRMAVMLMGALAGALGVTGCAGFFITTTTTTTLTSSGTNVVYENSVTLTAKVVSASATGTVEFYDGSTELGSGTLTSGVATYTTTALTEGTHSLVAVYEGDSTYQTSTSVAITVVVSASLTATTTTLAANATTEAAGMSVVLTGTVVSSSATGTVAFFDGTTQIGTGTVTSGVATFTTTILAVGSHTLTAEYSGDSTYASSTSGAVTVTITTAATSS